MGAACRGTSARDGAILGRANKILNAGIAPPSLRQASRGMGEQLLELGATWSWSAEGVQWFSESVPLGNDRRQWHHPVVFGLLGSLAGAEPVEAVMAYLHQAALGMIGAGVRAIPVSHTNGQQLLAYLHDTIAELAPELADTDLESAGSGCPSYEVLCDAQTRLYSRMFRS